MLSQGENEEQWVAGCVAQIILSRNLVREIRFFSLFSSISACTILQPYDYDDDDYCCCRCSYYYFPDYIYPETEYHLHHLLQKCNITASFKGEWL